MKRAVPVGVTGEDDRLAGGTAIRLKLSQCCDAR
jgi:hypothetical protein